MTIRIGAASSQSHPYLESYDEILKAAQEVDSGWDFRLITLPDDFSSPVLCRVSGDPDIPSIYTCFISGKDRLQDYNEDLKLTYGDDTPLLDDPDHIMAHEWYPHAIICSDEVPFSEIGGFAIYVTFDDPSKDNFFTWDGPSDKGVTSEAFRKMGFAEVKGFNGETDAFCIGREGRDDEQFAGKIIDGIKEASRRWERFKAVSPDNS